MSYSNKVLFFCNKFILKYNLYFLNFNNLSNSFIGNYLCGDTVYAQLFYKFFNANILNIKYKVFGCGSMISSINFSFFYLLNKFYFEFLFLKNFHISNKLNLPSLKFHCSIIIKNLIIFNDFNYKNNYIIYFF